MTEGFCLVSGDFLGDKRVSSFLGRFPELGTSLAREGFSYYKYLQGGANYGHLSKIGGTFERRHTHR